MTPDRRSAVRFVILLGLVSLFADITYEGARSISGPFLATLGAGAAVVGVVSGFGEFLGHALRLGSGWLADRTRRYWVLTIVGYAVNLFAVPLLAFAGSWEAAAAMLILERSGKALRSPARDAMLSQATTATGHGWGFGLHEAMDQIGALTGPLLVAGVLASRTYRVAYLMLAVPAVLALGSLVMARFLYRDPSSLSIHYPSIHTTSFPRVYRIYLVAAVLMAAGFADFPLIAYHLAQTRLVEGGAIPLVYALAMGVDAVAALVFGRLFDRYGLPVLAAGSLLTALAAPMVFLGDHRMAVAGVALWGAGLGAQESIVRAAIATMTSPERRGSAFGLFHTAYGVAWFAGSAAMGLLYPASHWAVALLSTTLELASVPILLTIRRASEA